MALRSDNIRLVIIVFASVVATVHTFNEYKSTSALALSSVYDAMKHNLPYNQNRNAFLYDLRNKRNTIRENSRYKYYDRFPSGPVSGNEWTALDPPSANELVCTRRGDQAQTRIVVSDNNGNSLKSFLSVKYFVILLAAFFLPLLIFKLFILPMKILLGLKAVSLLNSLLLGALLLKNKKDHHQHGGEKPLGFGVPFGIGFIPGFGFGGGTGSGASGSSGSASASSSSTAVSNASAASASDASSSSNASAMSSSDASSSSTAVSNSSAISSSDASSSSNAVSNSSAISSSDSNSMSNSDSSSNSLSNSTSDSSSDSMSLSGSDSSATGTSGSPAMMGDNDHDDYDDDGNFVEVVPPDEDLRCILYGQNMRC